MSLNSNKKLLHHVVFGEVDVKCCVFTGSIFILKPEQMVVFTLQSTRRGHG